MIKVVRSGGRSAVSRYLSDIHAIPRLTREQEMALGERAAAGDRGSLDDLVVSNLGFVVKIATEYMNMGLPLNDLLNEGNIGLIRAASRYDHRRRLRFITYAAWWVRKTIIQALENHASTIRVPAYQRTRLARSTGVDDAGSGRFPRPVTSVHARVVSLEDPSPGPGRMRLADRLTDERCQDPEREIIRAEDLACLRRELSYLSEKERVVIIWRFGLLDEDILTLNEIGDKLGLSRERIRQIEESACLKLRARFLQVWDRPAAHSVANRSPKRLNAVTEPL